MRNAIRVELYKSFYNRWFCVAVLIGIVLCFFNIIENIQLIYRYPYHILTYAASLPVHGTGRLACFQNCLNGRTQRHHNTAIGLQISQSSKIMEFNKSEHALHVSSVRRIPKSNHHRLGNLLPAELMIYAHSSRAAIINRRISMMR